MFWLVGRGEPLTTEFDPESELEGMLSRLNRGDLAAAEQAFRQYEPYLRVIVRRQITNRLRAKFDSSDIVQSVWADLLVGFRDARWHFSNALRLKAFLVKATKNRFVDRVRQQQVTLDNEKSLSTVDEDHIRRVHTPRPSEQVRANELWQDILDCCRPQHRIVVEMKRQGSSLDEIAAASGYHKSSIRRILYDLTRKFACLDRRVRPPSNADVAAAGTRTAPDRD